MTWPACHPQWATPTGGAATLPNQSFQGQLKSLQELVERRSVAQDISAQWAGADELYRQVVPGAQKVAYLMCGDQGLAEDVTHDVFLKIVSNQKDFSHVENIQQYMNRSVINAVKSHWLSMTRRLKRQEKYSEGMPTVHAEDFSDQRAIVDALKKLSATQRAVIVLSYFQDYSDETIAKTLRCAVGTVKSNRSRGLTKLRQELSDELL